MSMKSYFYLVTLFILFAAFSLSANAQTVAVAQPKTATKTTVAPEKPRDGNETETRVRQLESQVQAMQAQIDALKNLIVQTQKSSVAATPAENKTEIKTEIKTSETAAIAGSEPKSSETAKTETKQPAAQTKQLGVDIGSARLTPYGTVYFNAFSNSGGTNNADVPLFATPTGAGNTSASVRQTRLGVRLEGARVGNANLRAVLEADFFGGFPSVGIGENFGVVRLRLANARQSRP